jgi:hypothetical protein
MTGVGIALDALSGALTNPVPDGTVIYTTQTPGNFSFTVPTGVSFIWIEGWAGGGPGSQVITGGGGGGGGGGGKPP